MTYYIWLKAFHVAAVLAWVGGVLALAVAMRGVMSARQSPEMADSAGFLFGLHYWNRCAVLPAMLVAGGLGAVLAAMGQWLPSFWLLAKLALVFVLVVLHAALSGILDRTAHTGQLPTAAVLRQMPLLIMIDMAAVAVLAVLKPFQ